MRPELARALAPCRRAGWGLALLTGLRAALLVALAMATRGVLNSASEDGRFALWCAALLGLSVLLPLLGGGISAWSGRASDESASTLQRSLLERLEHKDCAHINAYHSGHLYSRLMGDCRTACGKYLSLLPEIFGQAIQLCAAFVTLAVLRPPLAAVLAACGALAALAGLCFRRVLKSRHTAERRAAEQLTACLQEELEHLEVTRSVAADGESVRRFGASQSLWLRARKVLRRLSVGGWTGFSLVLYLGSGAAILWGALLIHSGSLSFGDLTAILQLIGLFRSPVTGLTGVQSQLAAVDAAIDRLNELYELPDEPVGEKVPEDAKPLALLFDHVTFAYAGEERAVLRDFSARVPLDRWTCLTGMSGRGKSTLYRLILGAYRPQEGSVLLETDRGTYPCTAATRRFFGFVPQPPVLFSGTVRENLLLADPKASDGRLWEALDAAACDFLRELPQGLDTTLGEDGEGLSAGQRQRIAIARALLRGAPVLLLDEITSALDGATETEVLGRLHERYPAALTATHRPQLPRELGMAFLDLESSPQEVTSDR